MGLSVLDRLRYIQRFHDRHGNLRLYLRRKGHKAIPLPPRDDPTFYEAYAAALASTAPAPKVSRVTEGSLEALALSYLATSKFKQHKPTTQAVYLRIIRNLCAEHGAKPIALLQPAHVVKMIEARSDTPAAANHVLRTLRALMKHAVRLKWRLDDPTQGVERLKEVGEGAETWTEHDIEAYEARWPIGTRQRLALALLLYTGQRRSDVVRMGRQHVRDGLIEVRQVKTGARLFIPLVPELADLIAGETDRLTFLVTEAGKPFTPNGFYMRFRGWVEAAGLPAGRSPHGLRKAAATRLADAGCTPHQIAAITGHKSLAEVERYTRAADQKRLARSAAAHLGGHRR